jgi:hypothetical protein
LQTSFCICIPSPKQTEKKSIHEWPNSPYCFW